MSKPLSVIQNRIGSDPLELSLSFFPLLTVARSDRYSTLTRTLLVFYTFSYVLTFLPVMALKLLVNAGLLVIPIGGSLGALFGIDAHRSATGQTPLFTGDGSSDGSTGGSTGGSGADGSTTNNGVTNSMYCQDSYGISPPSDGQLYTRE